jgi:hypothetical protein
LKAEDVHTTVASINGRRRSIVRNHARVHVTRAPGHTYFWTIT